MTLTRNTRGGTLISLRELYIKYCVDDPTEVTFVDAVFGDFAYWTALLKCKWLHPYLEEWKQEADVRRKSKAFKAVIKEVENNGRSAFSAAKFLITEPNKPKTKESKETIKKTTEKAKEEYSEDIVRLQDFLPSKKG